MISVFMCKSISLFTSAFPPFVCSEFQRLRETPSLHTAVTDITSAGSVALRNALLLPLSSGTLCKLTSNLDGGLSLMAIHARRYWNGCGSAISLCGPSLLNSQEEVCSHSTFSLL